MLSDFLSEAQGCLIRWFLPTLCPNLYHAGYLEQPIRFQNEKCVESREKSLYHDFLDAVSTVKTACCD